MRRGERVRGLAQGSSRRDLEQGQGSGKAQLQPPPHPLIPYWPFRPSSSSSQRPNERAQARASNEHRGAETTCTPALTSTNLVFCSCNKPKGSGGTVLKARACVTARLNDAEAGVCENDSQEEGGGGPGGDPCH